MYKSDIVEYLERLERQLQTAVDSMPENAVSTETAELFDDLLFSIACHADIINSETIEND